MANAFKSNLSANLVTTGNTVYTCPAATQTIVIGCSLANKTGNTVTGNVYVRRDTTNYTLVAGAVVTPGSSLVVIGGDQKVALQVSDSIIAIASANATLDCVLSVLEIT
jgi:hypothetical protein